MTEHNDHLVIAVLHQAVGCNKETQRAKERPKPKRVADSGNTTLVAHLEDEMWNPQYTDLGL